MGVYSLTLELKCDGTHQDVLSRFNKYWTTCAATSCSGLSMGPFNAPAPSGNTMVPDAAFVNAMNNFVLYMFMNAMFDDINKPVKKIASLNDMSSLITISSWSPGASNKPHEGGPVTIQVNYATSSGTISQTPWLITAPEGQTGYVKLYAAWRYT